MSGRRLDGIPGFSIDRVAAAAGDDPEVLRLENLDTDIPPPDSALEATRAAIGSDDANSYLPFTGRWELRQAAAHHVEKLSGVSYAPDRQCVITAGGTEGMLDALLAITEPGDEVVLTDPTYAGMIQRVRLVGCRPVLVPFRSGSGEWRLDLAAFEAAVTDRTTALFLMNPSMPSGAVLDDEEWEAVRRICVERDLWLLYNAAMERILFDGRRYRHPAALEGMASRTITVGSVSKEYRMIGWRVGWVVGPESVMADVARAGLYTVVTPVGLTQGAAAAALADPDAGLEDAVREWQRRRDLVCRELEGLPLVPAAGGWSMLLDVAELGYDAETASARLLETGRIAATPMTHWGELDAAGLVRFVFSNEPLERLAGIGERVQRALG